MASPSPPPSSYGMNTYEHDPEDGYYISKIKQILRTPNKTLHAKLLREFKEEEYDYDTDSFNTLVQIAKNQMQPFNNPLYLGGKSKRSKSKRSNNKRSKSKRSKSKRSKSKSSKSKRSKSKRSNNKRSNNKRTKRK